jgi:hypothetical protein
MSNINNLLARILADYSFFLQFRDDPKNAIEAYRLTPGETAAINDQSSRFWTDVRGVVAQNEEPHNTEHRPAQFRLKIYNKTSHMVASRSAIESFKLEEELKRPEIANALHSIHAASSDSERSDGVSDLIDNIG